MRGLRGELVAGASVLAALLVMAPVWGAGKAAQANGDDDGARGREIFEKRCTGCHALEVNREGPRLRDVFGRTSGQVAGYAYSPALVKARVVWNETTLDAWLTDTDALVPGNNMDFRVPKAEERQELIRFLKEQAGK
ncbi:MAG: c-type cytochrome [Acidobacteriaceae bacterium]